MVDVATAVFVLTLIIVSNGLTIFGMFRYLWKMDDTPQIKRNQFVLGGNASSVVALLGTIYILFSSGEVGILPVAMVSFMLFSLIIVLYLTNYDPEDLGAQTFALTLSFLDIYVKTTAVLMGYGVCTVEEVPGALAGMASKLLGGRR
jgi:hypothetical protein